MNRSTFHNRVACALACSGMCVLADLRCRIVPAALSFQLICNTSLVFRCGDRVRGARREVGCRRVRQECLLHRIFSSQTRGKNQQIQSYWLQANGTAEIPLHSVTEKRLPGYRGEC